jgi:benzoyl-CoA reductase/2-hydroxyglutaryl-CoA dehydratase subunit BcrC/BadD/HgdB
MSVITKEATFRYPERIKEDFLKTPDIHFENGEIVSARKIWDFMTEEAPRRFPHAFDARLSFIGRLSDDVDFFSGIKREYLQLSLRDRALAAHDHGIPLVMTQGGQTMETYYAAGSIPLRPGLVMQWARDMQEGLNLRQSDQRGIEILETGRNKVSMEACNQIGAHSAVASGVVPIDLVAPYLALRCSDMAYLVESHRGLPRQTPIQVVDYPINQQGKPWAVDLVAEELRKLIGTISKLSKKKVTEAVLHEHIVKANKARGLARSIINQWWEAELPPTNSLDINITHLANDFLGDPSATIQVLEETKSEVEARIKNKVLGRGLSPDPKRIFICGSCVGPNPTHVEQSGGVVVGRDDSWNLLYTDVKETGDPIRALAEGILGYPYELPTTKRAQWTAETIKKSRADGVIFMYNWGCNYQTSVARMMADLIKEETGLPTTFIEVGELGRSEATEQSENRVEAFIEML